MTNRSIRSVISICISALILLNLSACGKREKSRYEAEFLLLFDTLTKIVAYTDSREEFSRQAQGIHDNLKAYHELYDIYNEYEGINNLKTINEQAGIAPVKVDRRIIDLIRYAEQWYEKTEGTINIAYGAVLSIWHDYRSAGNEDPEAAQLPPLEILKEAEKHTDIRKIIINEKESTVFLEDPDMSLDVGAIAKGYATEQVARMAVENGFISGLISVGGNVRAVGGKGEGDQPWNLGIQNPDTDSEQAELYIVNLKDTSLVTSGTYERYYTVGDVNYHHIIDPKTLYPSTYFSSITIICKDSGMADALSTAVFNMPFEQGLAYIEKLPGIEALWVLNNGEQRTSDHFMDFIVK